MTHISNTACHKNSAILLVGPTGSGKSPLGDLIGQRGLWGRPCAHFDFGATLRATVERRQPDDLLTKADLQFLGKVLRTGALLEDEHFPLAARILRSFLAREQVEARTVVVLNGLPRHVGQAKAMDAILDVEAVIELRCTADTVIERIRTNIGGDREGRTDDYVASVRNKLEIYAARTVPLVDYFREQGRRIEAIEVAPEARPEDVWQVLESRGP